ncbi:peptidoglycan recognition protein family protein [Streptomyces gardneri]|uniref:peptidoglycan recognition protein family protein n=1 Tax=Streptomyces gardneri TaxID=66892 RepID=UPI0035E31017
MTTVTGPNPRRRTLLTGAFALGAATVLPVGLADRARAAADAPVIADCAVWGARPPGGPLTILPTPPVKIIVHHTATPNVTDHSREQAFRLARSMQNWAMEGRSWTDTGQHFSISRGAYVVEGRHGSLAELRRGTRTVESAHCTGQNAVAIGIENEGTYTSVDPRGAQYAALVDLCAHICRQYGLRAYQIYGHRDFNATDCPGDRLYVLLPQLRRDVAARIGGDPTAPLWPVLRAGATGGTGGEGDAGDAGGAGATGDQVRALQHLLVGRGAALTADGSFGPATEKAVRDFQGLVHATADGLAGNQTWHQLVAPVGRDASGEAVRAVQVLLGARGVPTAVDGVFDAGTQTAVTTFQTAAGLPADGVVDARTFGRLLG